MTEAAKQHLILVTVHVFQGFGTLAEPHEGVSERTSPQNPEEDSVHFLVNFVWRLVAQGQLDLEKP